MSLRSSVAFHNAVIDAAESLRPLPRTVTDLAAAAAAEGTDIDDIVRIVETDPVLVSALLREANSAASASQSAIGTVDTAVVRLGVARTVAIAVASCIGDLTEDTLTGYGLESADFWTHSRAAMLVAELLVGASRGRLDRMVVTAAIIHDIGKIVLSDYIDPAHFEQAFDQTGNEALADRLLVDLDHAEVSALLVAHWRLPTTIVHAVQGHHCLEGTEPLVARGVHISDTVAKCLAGERAPQVRDVHLVVQTLGVLDIPPMVFLERCAERFDAQLGLTMDVSAFADFI